MNMAIDFMKQLKVGMSIGDTLDAFDDKLDLSSDSLITETCWGNPVITFELLDAILAKGFRVIRFPVTWRKHIGPAPEYKIDDAYLKRVSSLVKYAYEKGAYIILNLHHEDWNYPYYDNKDAATTKIKAVWFQLCAEFAELDEHLIFEAQNEPRKIDTPLEWNGGDQEGWDVVNATNHAFVETVRNASGYNKTRYLMLPGYAANCTVGIRHIELPADDRIMVSVHAYEPWDFCLNIQGRKEWNHDTQVIDSLTEELKERFISKGIPVVIGEFGAMNKENDPDRVEWVKYYTRKMKSIGVPCVWWDNAVFQGKGEKFGLFNRNTYEPVFPEVLEALLDILND